MLNADVPSEESPMSRLLLAVVLCAANARASAQVLKLRAGTDESGAVAAMDAKTITLSDGRVLPRFSVSEIQFATRKETAAPAAADPAARERGRELFRRADAFGKKYPGADGLQLVD